MTHERYRSDIDGLRALAVVSVIVFHAFPTLWPGGFIGVDIFFVISGYLISGILFRALASDTFSIADFYVRRVKRIFPALVIMLGAVLGFGYLALLSQEFKQLGTHAAGGAGFVANLVLWRESGYFDNSAETKPLLHLWSLGVEEQFYIIWPLLVFCAWRRRGVIFGVTAALALGSFYYNVANVLNHPVTSFYSPLSRFWELAMGGLLAYRVFREQERLTLLTGGTGGNVVERNRVFADSNPHNARSVVGFALILVGLVLTTKTNAFPGFWALLPVIGATTLISAGPRALVNRVLLSNRVAVWVGTISYPLYLWHWPLLSYAHIIQGGKVTVAVRIGAVALSVLLAWLTFRFIEKPIRFGAKGRSNVALLVGCMALLGGAGYGIATLEGLPQRDVSNYGKYLPKGEISPALTTPEAAPANSLGKHARATTASILDDSPATEAAREQMRERRRADVQYVSKMVDQKNTLERYRTCHLYDEPGSDMTFAQYQSASAGCSTLSTTKKNVLVVGDSAAAELYLAMARAYPDLNFIQVTGSACKPFHAAYPNVDHRCVKLLDVALQTAKANKLDAVVLASSWSDDFASVQPELEQFKKTGVPVLLVGPPLLFSAEVSTTLLRMEKSERLDETMRRLIEPANLRYASAMADFAEANNVRYLNRLQLYCEGGCPVLNAQGEPLVIDKFHLSLPGVDLLGARIKANKVLENLLVPAKSSP